MKTLSKFVSTSSVSLLVITAPVLISGNYKKTSPATPAKSTSIAAAFYSSPVNTKAPDFKTTAAYTAAPAATATVADVPATTKKTEFATEAERKAFEVKMVVREAGMIYTAMNLRKSGLNQKAFEYAWRGYHNMVKKGMITNEKVLSICDFTQSSRRKRLYIIDVQTKKLLYNTYVAHGMNSGVEYATSFSNTPESFKSSLGFFVTTKSYNGRNGTSLRINGLEKGFNDNAAKRGLVLHGADYIGSDYLKNNGEMGRSLGGTVFPNEISPKIIKTIKNGSCFFVYYPAKKYLNASPVING